MKIWVESRFNAGKIIKALKKSDVIVTRNSPDFVIAYGGDGTILEAARKFDAPLVPIRKSTICSRCMHYSHGTIQYIIKKMFSGDYSIRRFEKVQAVCGGRKITGLNEIQMHNTDPRTAVRFSAKCGTVRYNEIIGDGAVASTVYGSTAYYSALGNKPFSSGIRVAFNNAKPKHRPLLLKGSCKIKLLRGPAALFADNNPLYIRVRPGSKITIKKSKQRARFVEF